MSVAAKIDRLVEKYGFSNSDDVSRAYAVISGEIGKAAFWSDRGYSDARTTGFVRSANLAGDMFVVIGCPFYGPRSRDDAINLADHLIPLNDKAVEQIRRFRDLLDRHEDVEVAA